MQKGAAAMSEVGIELEGLGQVDDFADMISPWFRSRALPLSMGEIMGEGVERIEHGTKSPAGQTWAAWSPAYASTRTGQHKLLFGDGVMADSFELTHHGDEVAIVSDVDYAVVHQRGSSKRNIEAREYMGLSRSVEKEIASVLDRDLERIWSRVSR
jgi:phage virion morphogenesis protein